MQRSEQNHLYKSCIKLSGRRGQELGHTPKSTGHRAIVLEGNTGSGIQLGFRDFSQWGQSLEWEREDNINTQHNVGIILFLVTYGLRTRGKTFVKTNKY